MASNGDTFWEALPAGESGLVDLELLSLQGAFRNLSQLFERGGGTLLQFENDSREDAELYAAVERVSCFLRDNVFRAAGATGIEPAAAAFAEEVILLPPKLQAELQELIVLPVDNASGDLLLLAMKRLLSGMLSKN